MNIGLFILLIFVLFLSGLALIRQYNYQKLSQNSEYSALKNKIKTYRLVLHEKQIMILLITNILLVISLAFSVATIFRVQSALVQLQKLTQTYYQSQEEKIHILEKDENKVESKASSPLKSSSSSKETSKKSSGESSTDPKSTTQKETKESKK